MVPCDPLVGHTGSVSQKAQFDPELAPRALFGRAWLRLLGDPAGQPGTLQDFLSLLQRDLKASGILWVPDAGLPVSRGRYLGKDVDWKSLRALDSGACRAMHLGAGLRRPWGAAALGQDWYARTRDDIAPAGRLRIWFSGRAGLTDPAEALDLAATVSGASVLIGERARAIADKRALQLGARAAGFVHDLRNRLTLVLLQQERFGLEEHGATSNTEGMELLEQARALCASFVPTGDMGLLPRATPLRPLLLREAKSASTMARRGSGVGIKVRCASDLQAWVDPVGLVRVLDNLLINAIEASQIGADVRLQAKRGCDGVQIIIEDNGAGMSEQGLQRAYSAGQSGSSASGGTGYGSASLLSTLAEMEGVLHVESAPGQGTRVQVTLPNPLAADCPRTLIVEPDARIAQGLLRKARREEQLALVVPGCTAAIRMVGEMNIQPVWLARGVRDSSLRDLQALLSSQCIPLHLASSRGLLMAGDSELVK